jgi:hypothetical protein
MVGGVPVSKIYVMHTDGTNVEELASGAMDNTSPSGSSDGESIV